SLRASSASRYEVDYNALVGLQQLAMNRHVAIIVVHHDRKTRSDEPFDLVSGTQALVGAADTVVIMTRQRWGASLFIPGRDLEGEIDIGIKLNPETLQWDLIGTTESCRISDQRRQILRVMNGPMSPREIADATGMKYQNVRQTLIKMANRG